MAYLVYTLLADKRRQRFRNENFNFKTEYNMKTNNKPAFPVEVSMDGNGNLRGSQTSNFSGYEMGLTKREYFASKAMQGLLSNPEWMKEYKGEKYLMQSDVLADIAIKTADNLLSRLSNEDEL